MLDVKLGLKPVAGIREFDQLVQPVLLLLQRTARPGFEKASGDLAKIGDRARLRGFLQRRPFAAVLQGLSPVLPFFGRRSEEHTSELQSLMRISYAVFCLKKKKVETCTS